MTPEQLREQLRELRLAPPKTSQKRLAKQLGVSFGLISQWETGETQISLQRAAEYAAAFGYELRVELVQTAAAPSAEATTAALARLPEEKRKVAAGLVDVLPKMQQDLLVIVEAIVRQAKVMQGLPVEPPATTLAGQVEEDDEPSSSEGGSGQG